MKHGRIGDYVRVEEGSGIESGQTGIRITKEKYLSMAGDTTDYLLMRGQRGSDEKNLAFILPKNGKPFVMYKNRLKKISVMV